jgi:hypothetical protein
MGPDANAKPQAGASPAQGIATIVPCSDPGNYKFFHCVLVLFELSPGLFTLWI